LHHKLLWKESIPSITIMKNRSMIMCPTCELPVSNAGYFENKELHCMTCTTKIPKQVLDIANGIDVKDMKMSTSESETTSNNKSVDSIVSKSDSTHSSSAATAWKRTQKHSSMSQNQRNPFSATHMSGQNIDVSAASVEKQETMRRNEIANASRKMTGKARNTVIIHPIHTSAKTIKSTKQVENLLEMSEENELSSVGSKSPIPSIISPVLSPNPEPSSSGLLDSDGNTFSLEDTSSLATTYQNEPEQANEGKKMGLMTFYCCCFFCNL